MYIYIYIYACPESGGRSRHLLAARVLVSRGERRARDLAWVPSVLSQGYLKLILMPLIQRGH